MTAFRMGHKWAFSKRGCVDVIVKKRKRFAKAVSQVAGGVHVLQSAPLITASRAGSMLVHWLPVNPSAPKPRPGFSIEDDALKKSQGSSKDGPGR